ncbi:hypothetical protein [Streptomyces sp. NPDC046925]|uniref:hypothetical protein n=1 Tax=Streptomyces sp. NPDC046925 TaxID=3155375 RepID=UPI0033CA6981
MTRPVVTCAACGEKATHKARGWCNACYKRWLNGGRPEGGPPPPAEARCNTSGGWHKHKREGTKVCDGCRRAHAEAARGSHQPVITFGNERHYSEPTARADWNEEQRKAAHTVALASPLPDDRLLLLQTLGLAPGANA